MFRLVEDTIFTILGGRNILRERFSAYNVFPGYTLMVAGRVSVRLVEEFAGKSHK